MDCNILIVDPEMEARDYFHDSFSNEGVAALIAEEVNLARALRFIETENLHYLFLGPNLQPLDIRNFIKETAVCSKMPVIMLLAKANKHLENEFIREGITSTLPYPVPASALAGSIEVAKEKFYGKNESRKISPSRNIQSSDTSKTPTVGTAHQLALVLSKLSIRLNDFSKLLSGTPIETDIKSISIPLAVNEVIAGVSKLRKGREEEDLEKLFQDILEEE